MCSTEEKKKIPPKLIDTYKFKRVRADATFKKPQNKTTEPQRKSHPSN